MFSETNENLDPQCELHLLKIKKTIQFHEGCKVQRKIDDFFKLRDNYEEKKQ